MASGSQRWRTCHFGFLSAIAMYWLSVYPATGRLHALTANEQAICTHLDTTSSFVRGRSLQQLTDCNFYWRLGPGGRDEDGYIIRPLPSRRGLWKGWNFWTGFLKG
jgi:hypothetical protein